MLNETQRKNIEEIIKNTIRNKLLSYKPETINMPFHYRLLGKDRMALFSFIHSLNTTFGTSIFEPLAKEIARSRFPIAETNFAVGDQISDESQKIIQSIMNELTIKGNPNKTNEIERIRAVCRKGNINEIKTVKVDLFIQSEDGVVHLFDLKTAKPNISNFKDFKRTLLEWIAIYLFRFPKAKVNSYLAIPYNPYEPEPYQRWTLKGMLDLNNELMVAFEFWDFLGGEGCYEELLDCFERAGLDLRAEIDEYFSRFK